MPAPIAITSVFNDGYIAEQFEAYRRDPNSVDESWRQFFRVAESLGGAAPGPAAPAAAGAVDASLLRKAAGAMALVEAIREYGHLAVQIDPLGSPPLLRNVAATAWTMASSMMGPAKRSGFTTAPPGTRPPR